MRIQSRSNGERKQLTRRERTRSPRAIGVGAAGFALTLLAAGARADALRFGPHDVTSLFTISKSENKNEVVYAVHLDERCAPVGDAPVFAFWRMHEKGPNVIAPLLDREQRAYGVARERVLAAGPDGGSVELSLRALPSRPIVVRTQNVGGTCQAWSSLSISGTDAYLYNVYVKLKTLGVDYLLLSGWTADRSRVVHETIAK
jgi:hypothetical protein